MKVILTIGLLLNSTGCITTFQNADVLPRGKRSVGIGYTLPAQGEIYSNYGLGNRRQFGVKVGFMFAESIHDSFEAGLIGGEYKVQFGSQSNPRAFLFSGGLISNRGENWMWLSPALIFQKHSRYFGGRISLFQETRSMHQDPVRGLGGFAGFAWRPYKGRLILFPEVSINTFFMPKLRDGVILLSFGIQLDL